MSPDEKAGRLLASIAAAGDRTTVKAAGEVDFGTSPLLAEVLAAALRTGAARVDVQFSQVTFCDCSGLNVLLDAHAQAADAGVALGLSGSLAPVVDRVLSLTRLKPVLVTRSAA
jgi:anti-anti-sigma factor